ncbi:hypothetical protein CNY89_04610 [Amaricoccus sp. HAR-UPW-R2A-40]|nr:hypothetical protein CNY89_04610 [Amaricoccus sp. HAR-UPW-R2A-40]
MTFRTDFLNSKILGLCGNDGRLVPPRGMGGQAQADELAALGRALDRLAPSSGYESWWSRFEDALLAAATTRAWPLIGDVERAAKSLREGDMRRASSPGTSSGIEPAHIYGIVEEWWLRFRDAGPASLPNAGHAKRLVEAGHAAYGELWRKGFPIPDSAREQAKAEKAPDHEAVLAEIRKMGERLRPTGIRNPAFAGAAE